MGRYLSFRAFHWTKNIIISIFQLLILKDFSKVLKDFASQISIVGLQHRSGGLQQLLSPATLWLAVMIILNKQPIAGEQNKI